MSIRFPCAVLLLILSYSTGLCQDVLTLAEGHRSAKITVDRLDWLVGSWAGTGLGGTCDEVWLPPADGAMQGVFRLFEDGRLQFSEYMSIVENDTATVLRLKHFGRDLTPWEPKDKWVDFPFIKAEGTTAWFNGITYHVEGDTLLILLRMRSKERTWTEELRFSRK